MPTRLSAISSRPTVLERLIQATTLSMGVVLVHLVPDAVVLRSTGWVGTGVALIEVGQIHRVASDLLHLFGQRGDLLAVAFIYLLESRLFRSGVSNGPSAGAVSETPFAGNIETILPRYLGECFGLLSLVEGGIGEDKPTSHY